MKLKETFKLSRRELIAYRTRSRATIITIGVLFGFLLAILLIIQGLENVVIKYAGHATNGEIYLASSYENAQDDELILDRVQTYGGEIITLTDTQKEQISEELPTSATIAKFSSLPDAYNYYSKKDATALHYSPNHYMITELFSNQISAYGYFRKLNHDLIGPASIVLVLISAFILAFTMAHLLASNVKTFVLYRSLGASKLQLAAIYFTYLLELCARAALFAIALAIILASLATLIGWNYLSAQLSSEYPGVPTFWPVLIGVNWQCLAVLCCIFLAAPISFVLCIDQFSDKRIAQRLKGD